MSKQPLTKKQYRIILIVAIFLFLLAFSLLAAAAILQGKGVDNGVCIALMASFFVLLIADIIYLFANFGRMMEYEIELKSKKLDEGGIETVKGITKAKIKESCLREGFQNKDSLYYHKRVINLAKDVINYFVKGVECDDIVSALDKELEAFDAKQYKNKNKCLMLFFFKDGVTEEELKHATDVSKSFILTETAMNLPQFDTAVIIVVDTQKDEAYFVPCKARYAVYTYGIKMLNTLAS